jgi:hypothetical protein
MVLKARKSGTAIACNRFRSLWLSLVIDNAASDNGITLQTGDSSNERGGDRRTLHPLFPNIWFMRIKRLRSPLTLYFWAMNICWPSALPVMMSTQTSKGLSMVKSGLSADPLIALIFPFSMRK